MLHLNGPADYCVHLTISIRRRAGWSENSVLHVHCIAINADVGLPHNQRHVSRGIQESVHMAYWSISRPSHSARSVETTGQNVQVLHCSSSLNQLAVSHNDRLILQYSRPNNCPAWIIIAFYNPMTRRECAPRLESSYVHEDHNANFQDFVEKNNISASV